MYKEIDKIIDNAEKINNSEKRSDYLYLELENLFNGKEFILSHFHCGYDRDWAIYVCVISWVDNNKLQQAVYRILVEDE